jgi:hypothetical protein
MTKGLDLRVKHIDPMLHGLFSYNIGSIYIESNLTAYKIGCSCWIKNWIYICRSNSRRFLELDLCEGHVNP